MTQTSVVTKKERSPRKLPMLPTGPLQAVRAMRRDPLSLLRRVADECGGVGGFRLGPQLVAVVSSPDLIHEVLVERPGEFVRGRIQRRVLGAVMGDGLLVSEGALHAKQRRLVLPHFVPRRIGRHVEVMVQEAERRIATWPESRELDLLAEMNALTMDIVTKLLFSSRLEDNQRLADAITEVLSWEMRAVASPVPLPMSVPTPGNRRARAALTFVRDWFQRQVDQRRAEPDAHPDDLLGLLLASRYEDGGAMPDKLLIDEVLTLWGAAQETSADAQAWTCYLLATHPDVYERARQEVDSVLGGRPVTHADLPRLPYTLQVFKESLRMYPPAAALMREAARDTEVGGVRIRRHTLVLVSPYALHHRPELYPEPARFDPDRFTRERESALPRHAFLPFGTGKHVCVGNHLAMMEGHVLTATLVQRVEVSVPPSYRAEPELVINIRPRGGLPARITHRPGNPFRDTTKEGSAS